MKCKQCGSVNLNESEKIFSNGTKHLELRCQDCNAHNGFKAQNINPHEFEMPFGKYKGYTLGNIVAMDREYVNWMLKNITSNSIVDRLVDVLEDYENKSNNSR